MEGDGAGVRVHDGGGRGIREEVGRAIIGKASL